MSLGSVGLLNVVLDRFGSAEEAVEYLNTHALDKEGNVAYHIAASKGKGVKFLPVSRFPFPNLNSYSPEKP